MRQQTNHKNRFLRILFTLFTGLLFVGVISVTSTQAENLIGTAKGVKYCDDISGKITKDKVKLPISINLNRLGTSSNGSIFIDGFSIPGIGTALTKNAKSGFFVFDTGGIAVSPIYITMSGKYKANKSTGEIVLISGNFVMQDKFNLLTCITFGKFKVKTDPNPPANNILGVL